MEACRKAAESTAAATYEAWGQQVWAEKHKSVEALGKSECYVLRLHNSTSETNHALDEPTAKSAEHS